MKPQIHITWSGSGKMKGISSINDDPYSNDYCIHTCPNRECCYAKFYCSIRPALGPAFAKNGDLMSKGILPTQMLPRFVPGDTIRIHSFGEYRNWNHLLNHRNMALVNDATKFVGWSHRDDLISQLISVPSNLRYIYSAPVNTLAPVIPKNFSGVYVPIEKNVAEENGITIVCKGQKCVECGRCYGKANPGIIFAKFKPVKVPAMLLRKE